jgi:hypothetical protein
MSIASIVIPARVSALRVAATGPIPITSGEQPATATLFRRASGSNPWRWA